MTARTATVARLAGRVRESGLRGTLSKAFADHVYRRSTSVVLEYRRNWGDLGRDFDPPPDLTFTTVTPEDSLPPLGRWLARRENDFRDMLANGKTGVFASDASGAVACVWLAFSDHHDARSREFYPIAPGEAYHYCWLVDPDRRRSTIAMSLCRHVFAYLRGIGVERQFGVVDRVNRPSFTILKRFGYRECGVEVIHLYLLRTRWTWTRRYAGDLGLLPDAARTR